MIASGNEYVDKMLRETSIVHLLQFILEQEFTQKEVISPALSILNMLIKSKKVDEDEVGDSDNAELVEVIIGLSHMIIKCSLAVKHRISTLNILCDLA